MKKLHALMKVIHRDPETDEAITFTSMAWASADSGHWYGACAVRISENRCIVRLATGLTMLMSIHPVPNSDSFAVSNDFKE